MLLWLWFHVIQTMCFKSAVNEIKNKRKEKRRGKGARTKDTQKTYFMRLCLCLFVIKSEISERYFKESVVYRLHLISLQTIFSFVIHLSSMLFFVMLNVRHEIHFHFFMSHNWNLCGITLPFVEFINHLAGSIIIIFSLYLK
jgi:hypothetical protein